MTPDFTRSTMEAVRDAVLSVLPDGWEVTRLEVWYSVPLVGDVLSVTIEERTMGWKSTLRVPVDSRAISDLKGKATSYVHDCMASTLPTPHQA